MKLIIVGGDAAGMSTGAKIKRNLGDKVEVIVYEKGNELAYGACGIPFYISDHIKDENALFSRSLAQFEESGINVWIFHEVLSVNIEKKEVTVKNLTSGQIFTDTYDKLVAATGATPNKFPPLNESFSNLFSVRKVLDGTKIKEMLQSKKVNDVIVVGAGFIGLELAEACHKHNVNVTLIELDSRIIAAMDEEITEKIEITLHKQKIKVYTGAKISEVMHENGEITGVMVNSPDGDIFVSCQLIVNCAGIRPATDWICGVDKFKNGALIVDETMQTSVPDIYAAGDCSVMRSFVTGQLNYAPLGTNANKQGRIIADVLANGLPKPFKLIGSAALRLFELDIAKVGISEQEAKKLDISYKTTMITANSYASYYGTEKLMIKLLFDPVTRKILGAQAVGSGDVVPRANYFAIAISFGLTVDDMSFIDLCYSPPFSGVWDASLIAANACKN